MIDLWQYASKCYVSNRYTGLENLTKELHCQYLHDKLKLKTKKPKTKGIKNARSK